MSSTPIHFSFLKKPIRWMGFWKLVAYWIIWTFSYGLSNGVLAPFLTEPHSTFLGIMLKDLLGEFCFERVLHKKTLTFLVLYNVARLIAFTWCPSKFSSFPMQDIVWFGVLLCFLNRSIFSIYSNRHCLYYFRSSYCCSFMFNDVEH